MHKLKEGEKKEVPNWRKYEPLKKIIDTNTPNGWDVGKVTLVQGDFIRSTMTRSCKATEIEVVFTKENRDQVRATFSGSHIRSQLLDFAYSGSEDENSATT